MLQHKKSWEGGSWWETLLDLISYTSWLAKSRKPCARLDVGNLSVCFSYKIRDPACYFICSRSWVGWSSESYTSKLKVGSHKAVFNSTYKSPAMWSRPDSLKPLINLFIFDRRLRQRSDKITDRSSKASQWLIQCYHAYDWGWCLHWSASTSNNNSSGCDSQCVLLSDGSPFLSALAWRLISGTEFSKTCRYTHDWKHGIRSCFHTS